MTKLITDIGNWLVSSGALVALFVFAWKYLKPVLQAKQKHAKTVQERELLGLVDQLADVAVTSLVGSNQSGAEKFDLATKQVKEVLDNKGLTAQNGTIETAVQSAYEKNPLTPTVKPDDKVQTGVVTNG